MSTLDIHPNCTYAAHTIEKGMWIMPWKDHAEPDELARLESLKAELDSATENPRAAYRAYYSRLMRRCQARARYADKVGATDHTKQGE